LIQRSDEPFAILTELLRKSSIHTIVDGGASIGDTSLKLSTLFPDAQVYAFEPYPPFIQILEKKNRENTRIKVEPYALDETEGKRLLTINELEDTNSFFSSESSANQAYGDLMRKKGEIEVTSKTLDNWAKYKEINSIDMIKLDLQGNELAALKGASNQLSTNKVKAILCEVSFIQQYKDQPLASEVMSMLNSFDFDLFNLYQMHFHHGQLIQADAMFLHRSIADKTVQESKSFFLPHSKFIR
jgi:FkbM family methyltransferase